MWNRLCRFLNKIKQIGVKTVKVRYANNAQRLLLLSSFENWLPYDLKLIPFGRSNHKIKCAKMWRIMIRRSCSCRKGYQPKASPLKNWKKTNFDDLSSIDEGSKNIAEKRSLQNENLQSPRSRRFSSFKTFLKMFCHQIHDLICN